MERGIGGAGGLASFAAVFWKTPLERITTSTTTLVKLETVVHVLLVPVLRVGDRGLDPLGDAGPLGLVQSGGDHRVKLGQSTLLFVISAASTICPSSTTACAL